VKIIEIDWLSEEAIEVEVTEEVMKERIK